MLVVEEYGFVSRGQDRYSVPILPDAGIPTPIGGNRCPVECVEKEMRKGEEFSFCKKHKILCLAGGALLLYLILK